MASTYEELITSESLLKGLHSCDISSFLPNAQKAILISSPPSTPLYESNITEQFPTTTGKRGKIVQWVSGSGKTIGLIIKVLNSVDFSKSGNDLQGLVLVPTIYLAQQIYIKMNSMACFIENARISNNVNEKPRILITTPQDAVREKINVSELEILAIEEMNFMLEIGTVHRKFIKCLFNQLREKTEILCVGGRMLPKECFMYDDHLKDLDDIIDEPYLQELVFETFVYCPKLDQKISLLQERSYLYNTWGEYDIYGIVLFCNGPERVDQIEPILKNSIFPQLLKTPQNGKLFELLNESIYLIGSHHDWYGIDMKSCNRVVHFDVICDKALSRMISGRAGRMGSMAQSLYLPSNLEELDFVCEILLGSANCKYQRKMLSMLSSIYSDVVIRIEEN